MTIDQEKLKKLRLCITESIRVQRGGGATVEYIDPSSAMTDIAARHNHVVFARRGCGKTLLLQRGLDGLGNEMRYFYLNCEDYKRHSFPNVLVEILDSLFEEMERHFGGWFGKKRRARELLSLIRAELAALKSEPDETNANITESTGSASGATMKIGLATGIDIGVEGSAQQSRQLELQYTMQYSKVKKLDLLLPKLKGQVRDLFAASNRVKAIYILLDDYYFLRPDDQPFVLDYVHRLCKDTPLYFKLATLRHASKLYIEHTGQPTGAQERQDFQPLSIEFGLQDIKRTEQFISRIFEQYGKLAGLDSTEMKSLFKGDGFARLVLAGGGVPRDCLSLFLDAMSGATFPIGKDDVRELSRSNLDRKIQELKQDAHLDEQPLLLRGIYAISQFCMREKKVNSFVVEERELQEQPPLKALLEKLLDYRLVHEVGTAFTHKSQQGTFRGYIIDVGFYAGLRKLHGKLVELDLSSADWRERIRSSPVLRRSELISLWNEAATDVERRLLAASVDPGTDDEHDDQEQAVE